MLRQGPWDWWLVVCAVVAAAWVFLGLRPGWIGEADGIKPRRLILGAAIALGAMALALPVPGGAAVRMGFMLLVAGSLVWRRRGRISRRQALTLVVLRALCVVLACATLFEPTATVVRSPNPEQMLFVLVDTSGSMSVPDTAGGPSRLAQVRTALAQELPKLARRYRVQIREFSSGWRIAGDLAELGAAGRWGSSTDMVQAVRSVAQDAAELKSPVILLVSDGIDNTNPDAGGAMRGIRIPVHTVSVGAAGTVTGGAANLAVSAVECEEEVVVGHEMGVKARIVATGMAERMVTVSLAVLDERGAPVGEVQTQRVMVLPNSAGQVVEFTHRPTQPGVQRLGVSVEALPGERTQADNLRDRYVLVTDSRLRVLYLEGRIRPEYRELYRALTRDQLVELAVVLRVQQDKFSLAGTVEGKPLKSFPSTPEEMAKFDVVILGDVDASYLGPVRMAAIEQRVADGAGLVMIGGQNTFGAGGYAATVMERVLPVAMDTKGPAQSLREFVPSITPAGTAHPAMEGLAEWFGATGASRPAKALPPVRGRVSVGQPKAGSEVLLSDSTSSNAPVLVAQRYGKGRAMAFTVDTTYLWVLPLRELGQDSPYNRFWGQVVRWLAGADVRDRKRGAGVEALLSQSSLDLGEPVKVRAIVRDARGDVTSSAQVQARAKSAGGLKPVGLSASENHRGLYEGELVGLPAGQHVIEVTANREGKLLGTATLRLEVTRPADEMLRLAANEKLMARVSLETGGIHVMLHQADGLVEQLCRKAAAPQPVEESVPLWNLPRMLLWPVAAQPWPTRWDMVAQAAMLMGLLVSEWVLRRSWQV